MAQFSSNFKGSGPPTFLIYYFQEPAFKVWQICVQMPRAVCEPSSLLTQPTLYMKPSIFFCVCGLNQFNKELNKLFFKDIVTICYNTLSFLHQSASFSYQKVVLRREKYINMILIFRI